MAGNMKRSVIVLACVIAIVGFGAIPSVSASLQTDETTEVFFSPNGGATDAVVREITSAREEIFIQAYSFTSKPIATALLDAHKRDVKIIAVLDKRQKSEKHSAAALISTAGIPVLIDTRHAIAHNKVMIMDRSTLITGSFNFTAAAEGKNAENLLVMKGNQPLIDQYLRNFETHKEHSVPYEDNGGERVDEPGFPTLSLDGRGQGEGGKEFFSPLIPAFPR
ncbi:MAG: phospholipase D family protein, partial [Nitrospinae bacterium]|nr:phospholipase D family protein [Nitrospinota bacterium]